MVKIIVAGKPDYEEILTQTRCKHDIKNRQVFDYSQSEISEYSYYKEKYAGDGVKFRNDPNPIYNCHGMTFASSRTSVGPESIDMIIEDDGYTQIEDFREVEPGDVVLYHSELGEVSHSGVVVAVPSKEDLNTWVISKWGKFSEAYHRLLDCPYAKGIDHLSYWRITK